MEQPEPRIEIVETVLGPVEVGRQGTGKPVLFIHGTPGGQDISLAMGRFLVDAGFEVIAPSRPGYLGTPLTGGESVDSQADLMAALLAELGHLSVGLMVWSGGGPAGYRLAVRHPQRVNALVALNAVSKAYVPAKEGLVDRLTMHTTIGNTMLRFLARHASRTAMLATLKAETRIGDDQLKALMDEALNDISERDVAFSLANVAGDWKHRERGVENDLAQLASIQSLDLEEIRAPTLIVSGDADNEVASDHSDHAEATIPGAERLVMPDGGHVCLFIHPEARSAQARVAELFRRCATVA